MWQRHRYRFFFKQTNKQTNTCREKNEEERKKERISSKSSAVASAWRVAGSSERTRNSINNNNRPIFVSRIIICLYTVPNRTPCTVDSNGRRERKSGRKEAFIHRIYLFIEPPAAAAASSASELSWAELLSSVEERERSGERASEPRPRCCSHVYTTATIQ